MGSGQTITELETGTVLQLKQDVQIFANNPGADIRNSEGLKRVHFEFYEELPRGARLVTGEKFTVTGEVTLFPTYVGESNGVTIWQATIPVRHANVQAIKATAEFVEQIEYLFRIL